MSTADPPEELQQRFRDGVITREEFEQQRDALRSDNRRSSQTGHPGSTDSDPNNDELVRSSVSVVTTGDSVEALRDDPYIGPNASFLKPWKPALWIALPCSLFVCGFGIYQHSTGNFISAQAKIPLSLAVFYQRLSILFMVGWVMALLLRRYDHENRILGSLFSLFPNGRGYFGQDEKAQIMRRILNVRLCMWGSIIIFFSSVPWVLSAFQFWQSRS